MAKNLIREFAAQLSGEAAYRLLELTRDSDPDTAIQAARRLGLHAAGRSRRTSKRTSVKSTAKAAKRAEMFAAIHRDPAHQLALLRIIRSVVAARQVAPALVDAVPVSLDEAASITVAGEVEVLPALPVARVEVACACYHELQMHSGGGQCQAAFCRCTVFSDGAQADEAKAEMVAMLPARSFFPSKGSGEIS